MAWHINLYTEASARKVRGVCVVASLTTVPAASFPYSMDER